MVIAEKIDMQDAFNLAWKLALVAKGRGTESLLDSFSAERSYVGDQVLKNADRLTAVGRQRNPVFRAVRDVVGHLMLGLACPTHDCRHNDGGIDRLSGKSAECGVLTPA